MNKYSAVIFDMDGVISDTQSVYAEIESRLFAEYGVVMTPDEVTKKYAGWTSGDILRDAFPALSREQHDDIAHMRISRIQRALEEEVVAVPGTLEVIRELYAMHIRLAVASASRNTIIEHILTTLGVRDAFRALVSSQEVPRGKPFPDVFLKAARQLETPPASCIVIEDSVHGMEAAKRAGMYCVGLVRAGSRDGLPADVVVADARDVDWPKLLGME